MKINVREKCSEEIVFQKEEMVVVCVGVGVAIPLWSASCGSS